MSKDTILNKILWRICVWGLLAHSSVFAQRSIGLQEAPDYLVFYKVNGSSSAFQKYQGAWFALDKRDGGWLLYGETKPNEVIFLSRFQQPLQFNKNQFVSLQMENNEIRLCHKMEGEMAVVCALFSWESEMPVFKEKNESDPAPSMVKRAKQDIAAGRLDSAIARLDSIFPHEPYFDPEALGCEMVKSAWDLGEALEKRRKFAEAAQSMHLALQYRFWAQLEKWKHPETIKQALGKAWKGVPSSLLAASGARMAWWNSEARKYDEAIRLANAWKKWFPEQPLIYLALADAAYGKRERETYPALYAQYLEKMKAAGKEKEIDPLAAQRATK